MSDLLDPHSRYVTITLLGVPLAVPENNTLLRCFQHLSPQTVSTGRFCWNRECGNSEITYVLPGDPREHRGRACWVMAVDGLAITSVHPELRWVLRGVLAVEGACTLP